ncbi:DNA mismatch repair protein MutL [Clavulina sp. PMI_390]|nr:DNA mismatch repair protein MutL [Clavulina sp. PMI_390]
MSAIHAIETSSVHKITSGQVVVDLQTAVKELVENSIDAGATSIEVRFKEYGLTSIELVDNGSGIAPEDYSTVAMKHHTSKLNKFEDLLEIESFGFRGEALASLCAICESVTMTTARKEESPMGTILEFDHSGMLKSSSGKIARQRGTTTTITGLFSSLPVRRHELTRNIKREFSKTLVLLNAYALYPCVDGKNKVRLTVSNQTDGGKKTIQFQTDGSSGTMGSISKLWGPKSTENITKLNLTLTVAPEPAQLRRNKDLPSIQVLVDGYISVFAHGKGRASNDRQFFYINGRPCTLPKVQKTINEVYRTFNTNQYPFIIANLQLPPDSYDVNVSPDKRTIFVHNEVNLVMGLRVALEAEFAHQRSTFAVNGPVDDTMDVTFSSPGTLTLRKSPAPPSGVGNPAAPGKQLFLRSPSPVDNDVQAASLGPATDRASTKQMTEVSEPPQKKRRVSGQRDSSSSSSPLVDSSSLEVGADTGNEPPDSSSTLAEALDSQATSDQPYEPPKPAQQITLTQAFAKLPTSTVKLSVTSRPSVQRRVIQVSGESETIPRNSSRQSSPPSSEIIQLKPPISTSPSKRHPSTPTQEVTTFISQSTPRREKDFDDPAAELPLTEIVRASKTSSVNVPYSASHIATRWKRRAMASQTSASDATIAVSDNEDLQEAGVDHSKEEAENTLSRSITKSDFLEGGMSVVGQFNLGFIIARLDRRTTQTKSTIGLHDDLFIIDQHASDEKFNFETLQETTKIQSQPLLRPRALELAASDEVTAAENLEVLKANGFEVSFSEDLPVGQRLHLVAQPQSKSTVFDMSDLEELLNLMQDQPSGHMVRCSKARAMFASRACRKSVMIGKPLNLSQMTSIVRHMATLDQPWSCPHGRPTMRHLADLRQYIGDTRSYKPRPIRWTTLSVDE